MLIECNNSPFVPLTPLLFADKRQRQLTGTFNGAVLAALATATDTPNKERNEGGAASTQNGREGEIEEDG